MGLLLQKRRGLLALLFVAAMLQVISVGQEVMAWSKPRVETTLQTARQAQAKSSQNLVAHVVLDEMVIQAQGTERTVQVDDIPDDAIVAGIDLKLSVSNVLAPALAVQVAAPGTTLLPVTVNRVEEIDDSTKSEPQADGSLAVVRTLITAHEWDGAAAPGAWTVKLLPLDATLEGQKASITLLIHYAATLSLPELRTGDNGAQPAFHRLPVPAWELDSNSNEEPQANLPTSTEGTPSGWQTIKYEGFEGSFPNSDWIVADESNDGYERYWDDDDYKPYGGSWSAWPANGGADGLDPQDYYYPNNMDTWMIYGPFDLSDAVDAQTVFHLWHEIETDYDYLFFGVSANGTDFYGYDWDGNAGWSEMTLGYSDWLGDSTVWVGWKFYSDGSGVDDGPFVDEITISKDVSSCGPFTMQGEGNIPDDGSWLEVPLVDRYAPTNGVVTDVHVKYLLDHPHPNQLEVQLAKVDSEVSYMLWSQGEAAEGASLGSALAIAAFNGAPAEGVWQLRVRDLVAGGQGRLTAASLRAHYASGGALPQILAGTPGQPTSLRIPDGVRSNTEEMPTTEADEITPLRGNGWQTIKNETFEGAFPNAGWTVDDLSDDGCEFLWDDDDFRPHNGGWAAWPANGGADGLDPATSNYPPDLESWMIYGPFDLSNASDADTLFWMWRDIEANFDELFFGVSSDGTNFSGYFWDGSADWEQWQVGYSDYTGDSSVWVAWVFQSDGSVQYEGPWIDDIEIRKLVGTPPPTNTPTATPSNSPTATPNNTLTATPTNTPTPTPTLPLGESINIHAMASQENINVGWNLVAPLSGNLERYELYRQTNGGSFTLLTSPTGTQYTDADPALIADVEYCYQTKALDSANNVIGESNITCTTFGWLTISVPDQVVQASDTGIPVTINLANGNGLCPRTFDIKVEYNQQIVSASGTVEATIYTKDYVFETNTNNPGEVKISAFIGSDQCVELYGPGRLFDIFFNVISNEGAVSPLDFIEGLTATVIYDDEDLLNPVPLELQNGLLIVGLSYIRGDINGDGAVNAADAALALDIASGLLIPTPEQEAACDTNGDNACNSADSSLILCYAAHQDWVQCGGLESANRFAEARQLQNNEQPVVLAIDIIESPSGETALYEVEISNGQDFAGGDFTFAYNPSQMTVIGASLTSLTSDFNIEPNSQQPGLLHVALASEAPIGTNGTIFKIEFGLINGVSTLDFGSVSLHDASGRDFETSALQREIQLVSYELCTGDFDDDDDVDIGDVQAIAYRWGTSQGDPLYDPLYDMDNDGDIDIADVQTVAYRWGTSCGAAMSATKAVAVPQAVSLTLQPSKQTVEVGETFTVDVMASGVTNLGAFEFTLSYDPALIAFSSASVASFPSSTGRTFIPTGPNDKNGSVEFGAFSLGATPDGPSGDGALATLTFTATASGMSPLNFSEAQVLDVPGTEQEIDQLTGGQVTIGFIETPTPNPSPTPTTMPTSPTTTPTSPTPTATPPAESINIHASASQENINVGWNLVAPLSGDLASYELYRQANGGSFTFITSIPNTQYTDADPALIADLEYCYQVKAVDSANNVIGESNYACSDSFGSLSIWVPDQVVNGTDVPVTINLANGNGLCPRAFDIKVEYDQQIVEANGTVEATIYTAGYDFVANTTAPGEVKISALIPLGECEQLYGAGRVFDVFFNVQGQQGDVSPLDFIEDLTATVIYDEEDLFNPVPLVLQNGSLTVGVEFMRGDVNGDGTVNATDAALALDIASGLLTPTSQQEAACDANGDGNCNAADSSLILCYAANQDWNVCGGASSTNRFASARRLQNGEQPVVVAIGTISQAGTNIVVPVEISNGPDFAGGDFTFAYDADQMEATRASLTSLTSDFELETNSQQPGIFHVTMASDTPIGAGGAILELEFTISNGISSIDFGSASLHDATGRDFETSALQREIQLVPYDQPPQTTPTPTPTPSSSYQLYLPAITR